MLEHLFRDVPGDRADDLVRGRPLGEFGDRVVAEIVEAQTKPEPPAVPSDERHHGIIPATAVLLAPRYDSKPLASVPNCWCCKAPWELDKLMDSKGKTYAWLKPACACLDVPQALGCCCLCVEHCRCARPGGEESGE